MKKFIFGIFSIVLIIPVLQSFADFLCGFIEIFKGKNTLSVLKINKEIEKIQTNEDSSISAIGFKYDSEEEYDDY